GHDIVSLNGLTFNQRPPSDRPPTAHKSSSLRNLDEFRRKAKAGGKLQDTVLRLRNRRLVRFAQPRSGLDERIEHRPQVERGATDDLEHVGSGCLLLQRFAQLVEQPRVLDGDDRLGGEIAEQLDLFIAEWPDLLAIDHDRSNQVLVLQHRHGEDGPGTGKVHRGDTYRIALGISVLRGDVGNVNDLFGGGEATDSGLWPRPNRTVLPQLGVRRRGIMQRNNPETLGITEEQVPEIRLANAHRVF